MNNYIQVCAAIGTVEILVSFVCDGKLKLCYQFITFICCCFTDTRQVYHKNKTHLELPTAIFFTRIVQ